MRPSACQSDLLNQLAQTPFLDRIELAALSGWSQSAVYRHCTLMERDGLLERVAHTTAVIPMSVRFCLSAAGVRRLAHDRGASVEQQLRRSPLSREWRRLILQRLDTAAVLYRLTTAISAEQYPVRFRWYRAQAMDAAVELPDGRSAALARIGRTADRSALAKRLRRLSETIGVGAALIVVPDETRLRHARRVLYHSSVMAFLAVEAEAANADADAPVWRIASGQARFTMREALSYAAAAREQILERPLANVSMPRPLDRSGPSALTVAAGRALDLISDWPWLRPAHLADLLDCGQRRTSQLLGRLADRGLTAQFRAGGKTRLALSDRGITHIAGRDRVAVGIAKRRWSVELLEQERPISWCNVRGARSRQLLRHLEHTDSVHWFIAGLARQAAAGGASLRQLDPPHRASRYFSLDGAVRSIHPDAFVLLNCQNADRAFFLEYERRADRPSMMRDRLAPYLRYYATRRPIEDHGLIPSVLVVLEDELAAHHFSQFAEREITPSSVELPLLVSSRHAVERHGPLGDAWRRPGERVALSLD